MNKQLQKTKNRLQAALGDGLLMSLDEVPETKPISSGSLSLDYATGMGGFPNNRVIEIAGSNGAGKSTLAFRTIDNALNQYPDRMALYLDVEGRIAHDWARKHVKNHSRMLISQPRSAEEATDVYVQALQTGDFCVAVFDSIGGAPSERVLNKSAMVGNIGGNALAITRFAQFAQTYSNKYQCLTIGIQQIREDLSGYNRLLTPGGQAWKHATSLRIELKRKTRDLLWTRDTDGQDVVAGFKVSAKIHKNSLGRSGTAIEYWLRSLDTEQYGPVGIDNEQELINLSILSGILEKGGAGVYHSEYIPGGKIRGYDKLIRLMLDDKVAFESMKKALVEKMSTGHIAGVFDTFEVRDESFDTTEIEGSLESMVRQ